MEQDVAEVGRNGCGDMSVFDRAERDGASHDDDEAAQRAREEEAVTMSRRARHRHVTTGLDPRGFATVLCGEEWARNTVPSADAFERVTCPKCSDLLFAKAIPANVMLERWDEKAETGNLYPLFRSVYRVLIDGVHRGYITAETGWGAGWKARRCSNDHRGLGLQVPGGERGTRYHSRAQAVVAMLKRIADDPRAFPPAISAADFRAQRAKDEASQLAAELTRKREWLAETTTEAADLDGTLAAQEARLLALRGINVEAPAAADALSWAIELAKEAIEQTGKQRDNRLKTKARLEEELKNSP